MNKETLFTVAKQLPDHFELDQLVDQLLLLQSNERGREQSRDEDTVSFDEVRHQMADLATTQATTQQGSDHTMTKEMVTEAMSTLPPQFELDALMERLIFIEKVEVGLAQLDRGESKTQEEVEALVRSWRK